METLARAANRGSIATGFDIENSVKFEADNTEYMKFTSSQTGSDVKRMAFNIWLKRTELGTAQTFMLLGNGGSNSTRLDLGFDSSDRLQIRNVNSNWRLTTQVFRDTSAWYHLFFQFNTLETTADDRIQVWVNGNLIAIGDYTTVNDPGYDATLGFNRNYGNILGGRELQGSTSQMFSGYIAQVYGSGGTPPSVTDFGEFDEDTGIWKPKDISGISPPDSVNGFFLDFTDSSDLGNDASGNGNNFTLNNITSADQATDTPTNNFAILNPLFKYPSSQEITEGNTEVTRTSGAGLNKTFLVTIPVNNGKWYAEFTPVSSSSNYVVGIMPDTTAATVTLDSNHLGNGNYPESIGYYSATGGCLAAGNAANGAYGDTYTAGNIIGIALDMDNGYVYFSKNSTWQNSGDPTSGSSGTGGIALTNSAAAHLLGFTYDSNGNMHCNFGGYTVATISSAASDANGYGNFEYAPPTGYYALCSKNLAEFG